MPIINPMPKGGRRPGAGRPPLDPSGEKRRTFKIYGTAEEEAKLREYLRRIREQREADKDSEPG